MRPVPVRMIARADAASRNAAPSASHNSRSSAPALPWLVRIVRTPSRSDVASMELVPRGRLEPARGIAASVDGPVGGAAQTLHDPRRDRAGGLRLELERREPLHLRPDVLDQLGR